MKENHIEPVTVLPAAVSEQLRPTAPEQAGLRGSSRATLYHHLPPSGCWDQLSYWIQSEVWGLNWMNRRQDGGTESE